jgi:SHS family lactate transporter-like MFS transporter
METIPPSARGIVSGLLQAGYPTGYLIAALVYAVPFRLSGGAALFVVGAVPALLSIYVMRSVQESTSWAAAQGTKRASAAAVLKAHWGLAIYAILLMTAFNFFSHSTQDLCGRRAPTRLSQINALGAGRCQSRITSNSVN